jgi:predicted negative regulator of RcsB-dependent stress response
MEEDLRKLVAHGDIRSLEDFVGRCGHTVWGPAALIHLAERYFADGRLSDAERQYAGLLQQYSDSPYGTLAKRRLAELKDRKPYERDKYLAVLPHQALSIVPQ